MNHESTIPNSSNVDIKQFDGTITLSKSVNNPGVKMLDFKSEFKPQTDDNAKLNDYNSAFQGLAMKITFDEGRITGNYESEMKDLKDRILEREDLIKDLTKKIAALTTDNSGKESKIIEQSEILSKKRKHIQFLENQISENLETSEIALKALTQENDTLKSNSRQSEVQVSELRTEVQNKVKFIHNLETRVAELTNEVVTKVKANKQLELDHNKLKKKSMSLEAKISELESQSNGKDQIYGQLVEEKQELALEVGNLQDQRKNIGLDLAKANETIQVLVNTNSDLRDQNERKVKNYSDKCLSMNNQISGLRKDLTHNIEEKDCLKDKIMKIENDKSNLNDLNEKMAQELENTKAQLQTEITVNRTLRAKLGSSEAKLKLLQQNCKNLTSARGIAQSTNQDPTVEINEMIMIDHFNIKLNFSDLDKLRGLSWLNDEIINFYLEMIMARSAQHHNWPKCYAMNTFFLSKLEKDGYPGVKPWIKKVDISSYDKIFVPVNLNNIHWCLAVIDMKKNGIYVYDSMGGEHNQVLKILLQYLKKEHMEKKGSIDIGKFTLENVKGIALQANSSDCGIFTLKYAEYLSRNAKITFTQEDIPNMRRLMIYEILSKTIIYQ